MGQQMRNKLVFSLMFLLSGVSVLRAGAPVMELIDVPTAEVLDRYGFDSTFRFYSGGGMLAKTHFGVFPRLLEARIRSDLRREEGAMRAIVTDEQRRSRTEAGLPSFYVSPR
jgi:hypothetical protein